MNNPFDPKARILVIDDMPTICQIIAQTLKGMGYSDILTASDGAEAWSILAKPDHGVAFVVSDWNMPNMSGIQLLSKVRETAHTSKLPFVLLTGENESSQITEALVKGVDGYILKPFTAAVFKDKLTAALKKKKAA